MAASNPPSSPVMRWQTTRFDLELSQPKVMGIVNLTPDSFSDGGQHAEVSHALRHAEQLLAQGADILDIGAESTRPGAAMVPLAQELARLEPFVREAVRWQVPISVDTCKPEVMQTVLDWGVDIINDIWALRQPGAVQVVAAHPSCGVCLMHMHRDPQTMQTEPMTGDVLIEVEKFLQERLTRFCMQVCQRPGWCLTQASVLAKRWRKISNCWPGKLICCVWGDQCWPGGPESRHWARHLARMGKCPNLRKGRWPVWLPPCSRWSGVPPWFGCTMSRTRWMLSRSGLRCARMQRCADALSMLACQFWDVLRQLKFFHLLKKPGWHMARQYFGTDGIRGTVGQSPITPDFILRLAHAVGRVLKAQEAHPTVLIGKDTRISGYMLESALESGFNSAGVDVVLLGPVPTPAVAYLTRAQRASLGVVISASHNPFADNGIKFFSAQGQEVV
jgi:hypothetical protein